MMKHPFGSSRGVHSAQKPKTPFEELLKETKSILIANNTVYTEVSDNNTKATFLVNQSLESFERKFYEEHFTNNSSYTLPSKEEKILHFIIKYHLAQKRKDEITRLMQEEQSLLNVATLSPIEEVLKSTPIAKSSQPLIIAKDATFPAHILEEHDTIISALKRKVLYRNFVEEYKKQLKKLESFQNIINRTEPLLNKRFSIHTKNAKANITIRKGNSDNEYVALEHLHDFNATDAYGNVYKFDAVNIGLTFRIQNENIYLSDFPFVDKEKYEHFFVYDNKKVCMGNENPWQKIGLQANTGYPVSIPGYMEVVSSALQSIKNTLLYGFSDKSTLPVNAPSKLEHRIIGWNDDNEKIEKHVEEVEIIEPEESTIHIPKQNQGYFSQPMQVHPYITNIKYNGLPLHPHFVPGVRL